MILQIRQKLAALHARRAPRDNRCQRYRIVTRISRLFLAARPFGLASGKRGQPGDEFRWPQASFLYKPHVLKPVILDLGEVFGWGVAHTEYQHVWSAHAYACP
jgi:hypothetical protein